MRSCPWWDTPQIDHDSADAKGPTLDITHFRPPSLNPSIRTPNTCGPRRAQRVVNRRSKLLRSPCTLCEASALDTKWRIWAHKEDILVLVSKALHKAHSRVCRSSRGTSVGQVLYLVDNNNMSVALAFEQRWAHVHRLLVHIWRFAALCLCRDVFATVRWIPSALNTSDAGSRKYRSFCTMQVNQCWPGWKTNTRAITNIVSLSTQQSGPAHQSVRRAPSIMPSPHR